MSLVHVVDDLESITAWVNVLIGLHTIAGHINISLDLRLLRIVVKPRHTTTMSNNSLTDLSLLFRTYK